MIWTYADDGTVCRMQPMDLARCIAYQVIVYEPPGRNDVKPRPRNCFQRMEIPPIDRDADSITKTKEQQYKSYGHLGSWPSMQNNVAFLAQAQCKFGIQHVCAVGTCADALSWSEFEFGVEGCR